MALVTTIGGRNSNSFVTLAQAGDYLATGPYDLTAWNELDDNAKELRLIMAAQFLGLLTWVGYPVYECQALCFPRRWNSCEDIAVPESILLAQSWIAYDVIHRGLVESATRPPSEGRPGEDISSLSLGGVISVSLTNRGQLGGDGSLFPQLIASCHFPIYFLLQSYLTTISAVSAGRKPQLLPCVD